MKIAVCLYGQPRKYLEGHSKLMQYINQYPDISFDIFYHTWHKEPLSNENLYYETSGHRNESIKILPNTASIIQNLYNPVAFIVEEPRIFIDDFYTDSIWYKMSTPANQANCSNTISQQYSRQQVRNLLKDYIEKTKTKYDFVIGIRFDFLNILRLNLYELDKTKLYVNNIHGPSRFILNDNAIVTNVNTFLCLYNVIENLHNIINNKDAKLIKYGEDPYFNPEQLLFENYLYYFDTIENIVYTQDIPNFI